MRGAATIALALASLILGTGLGSSALIAVAAALWLVAAYAAGVVLTGSRSVAIDRSVCAAEVVEGEPLELVVRVAPRRRLNLVAELVSPGGGCVPLKPGANRVAVAFERRGRHVLAPSVVRLRDPLRLFATARAAGPSVALLVLPRGQDGRRPTWRRALPRDSEPLEPDGLREYRPGTPASRVHWASLARGAGLFERRTCDERDEAPVYAVDTTGARDTGEVDHIVRSAVAHILRCARAGGCGVLLPGDDSPVAIGPDLRAWPAVHRRLAVLGLAD